MPPSQLCCIVCTHWLVLWWPRQGALGRRLKLIDVNNKDGFSRHDQLRDMAEGTGHGVSHRVVVLLALLSIELLTCVLLGDKNCISVLSSTALVLC